MNLFNAILNHAVFWKDAYYRLYYYYNTILIIRLNNNPKYIYNSQSHIDSHYTMDSIPLTNILIYTFRPNLLALLIIFCFVPYIMISYRGINYCDVLRREYKIVLDASANIGKKCSPEKTLKSTWGSIDCVHSVERRSAVELMRLFVLYEPKFIATHIKKIYYNVNSRNR